MNLRIGMVGAGFMGRTWAEVITKYAQAAELAGVAGGQRSIGLAQDYGIAPTDSVEALLGRDDIDAVIVATPQPTHHGLVLAAIRNRKHVLVEKPMAWSVAEADEMVAAAREAKVHLGVVSQHRFRQSPRVAEQLIREGRIGDLRMIHVRGTTTPWEVPTENDPYFDFASHLCDLLRWLVKSEPTDVVAHFATYESAIPPNQNAMVLVRFPNDLLVQIWFSYQVPLPGLGSMVQFTIVGSKGIIELDSYGKVQLGLGSGWQVVFEQQSFDPLDLMSPVRLEAYTRQLDDFVAAIWEGRDPLVSGAEGRATMALLEATRTSAASDSLVKIGELSSNP